VTPRSPAQVFSIFDRQALKRVLATIRAKIVEVGGSIAGEKLNGELAAKLHLIPQAEQGHGS
jgi:hypothetical protein